MLLGFYCCLLVKANAHCQLSYLAPASNLLSIFQVDRSHVLDIFATVLYIVKLASFVSKVHKGGSHTAVVHIWCCLI